MKTGADRHTAGRPLRILYVLSKLEREWRGGIGRVTSGAARALAERGHEVHLAGRARDGGAPGPLPGVEFHAWSGSLGKLGQLPRLIRLQRSLRADVVHFHSALPHGEIIVPFVWLRGALGDPRIVVTAHTGARGSYPKRRARAGLRAADRVIVPSQWSAERAIAAGAPAERTLVIWNGIDTVVPVDVEARRPTVLALGRLVPAKGMDVAIEAFDRAAAGRPEWRLVVGGEGSQLEELRRRASRLEHADRIALPGYVAGDAKRALLREASIGLVPSRSDMIPGAMLELQAHGIPTIASAVAAIPEGAADGRAARLVAPDDVEALAAALGELMDSESLRGSLSKEALAVSRGRVWPEIARQLEDVYRDLLRLDGLPPSGRSS